MTAELTRPSLDPAASAHWPDPYSIAPEEMADCIQSLETACVADPQSADLRTCLGVAYAMNYEVYKSIDALEVARQLEPRHFLSQLKYAELYFRLRALVRAEQETLKALHYATNSWQAGVARKQLQEVRQLMRAGTQKPEWTKPLASPALCLVAIFAIFCFAVYLK
ncbi:MAG: hypothetical protein ACJ746_17265 [Bryobacteraceae bacterium]